MVSPNSISFESMNSHVQSPGLPTNKKASSSQVSVLYDLHKAACQPFSDQRAIVIGPER